ncbi:hypothetical protein [Thiobacillus sp.]
MIKISCLATIEMHKMLDCEHDAEASAIVKARLKAAAMQVALDLRRDGYIVDLDIHYRTLMKSAHENN